MHWLRLSLIAILMATPVLANTEKPLPPPEGAALWQHINEVDPFEEWDQVPGYDGVTRAKSPHSRHVKLYVNRIGMEAYQADKPFPNGTIIVKVNYGADQKTAVSVTPMYKVEGYNSEAADWFWGFYSPEGKVHQEGKVFSCLNCHKEAQASNYVFSRQ